MAKRYAIIRVVAPGGVAASPLTTKGDIWVYSSADARLPVGMDGQMLVCDSSVLAGVRWIDQAAVEAPAAPVSEARSYWEANP